jgi:hypothetical protein
MCNTALGAQPEVRLVRQIGHGPLLKKLRRKAFGCGFICDVFGAILAKLSVRTLTIGFWPRATGTIETGFLVELQESAHTSR